MKGVYLLDVCNIVRAGAETLWHDDDRESREFLAELERRLKPSPKLRVVAVFDGPRRYAAPGGVLELRFSEHRPADEIILDLARASAHQGKSAWVVSWDQGLLARASEEGARALSPGEFEARLRRPWT